MALVKEREEDTETTEETEEAAPAARKPVVKENDEDGSVSVELGDEQPKKVSRKERRESRQSDEITRYREELDRERQRSAQLEQQIAQRFQQLEQRIPQQQSDDPYLRRRQSIRDEQENIQATLKSGAVTDPALVERMRKRFYDLNDEGEELSQRRTIELARAAMRQDAQSQSGQGEEAILRAEFPDVTSNQRALQYALGEYNRLIADPVNPAPQTLATSRKAMQAAAEAYKLRQPTAPAVPAHQQARFGSIPAQAGVKPTGASVHLEAWQKKMAINRWPDIDEHEAYAKMARVLRDAEKTSANEET